MTSLITTTLHIHFKVSCWQGGCADLEEIRWKAMTTATSAFHSCRNPFSEWSVRDYHLCFLWLKGEGLKILKEILFSPCLPHYAHQFEQSMLGVRGTGIKILFYLVESRLLWKHRKWEKENFEQISAWLIRSLTGSGPANLLQATCSALRKLEEMFVSHRTR